MLSQFFALSCVAITCGIMKYFGNYRTFNYSKFSFLFQMENSGVVHMLKHSRYDGDFSLIILYFISNFANIDFEIFRYGRMILEPKFCTTLKYTRLLSTK